MVTKCIIIDKKIYKRNNGFGCLETTTLAWMKLLIFLLFPLKLFCQDISGLWIGSLYNDSTQQNVYYELAISEINGKYNGYSYTTFNVNGKTAVGVKSIKISPEKNRFYFEDVDLLYNNYPVAPPKGVRQLTSVELSETDNLKLLTGKFITTRSKQYGKQVTGTVALQQKKNIENDKLMTILDELGLGKNLSFYKPSIAVKKRQPAKPAEDIDYKNLNIDITAAPTPVDPLSEVTKRTIETIETVYFTSDSLKLQLYDNGYVDGDSVSVIINNKLVLAHQRLTTQAITRTINSQGDSLKIIMFAENLGSIAPNTGLLIIYDGKKRHEIRFEGDLDKNAAVILKRRKP